MTQPAHTEPNPISWPHNPFYDLVKNVKDEAELEKAFTGISDLSSTFYYSAAQRLAYEHNEPVINLLVKRVGDKNQEYFNAIAKGHAKAKRDLEVERYRRQHNASLISIIEGYIEASDDEKIKKYINNGVTPLEVACAYARAGNVDMVDQYRVAHNFVNNEINMVAMSLAQARKYPAVEVYKQQYKADVHMIAKGYAKAHDYSKVREYQMHHNAIIELTDYGTFSPEFTTTLDYKILAKAVDYHKAVAKKTNQVEQLRSEYIELLQEAKETVFSGTKKEYEDILNKLVSLQKTCSKNEVVDPFEQALKILNQKGAVGKTLTQILERLNEGKKSCSPYWMNSSSKFTTLVTAIRNIPESETLEEHICNKESALYKALNTKRITSLTIFGGWELNKTQSIREIEKKHPELFNVEILSVHPTK